MGFFSLSYIDLSKFFLMKRGIHRPSSPFNSKNRFSKNAMPGEKLISLCLGGEYKNLGESFL